MNTKKKKVKKLMKVLNANGIWDYINLLINYLL